MPVSTGIYVSVYSTEDASFNDSHPALKILHHSNWYADRRARYWPIQTITHPRLSTGAAKFYLHFNIPIEDSGVFFSKQITSTLALCAAPPEKACSARQRPDRNPIPFYSHNPRVLVDADKGRVD